MAVYFSPVSFHGTIETPQKPPSEIGFQFITSNPVHKYKKPNCVQKLCSNIADGITSFANSANFRFRKLFNLKPKNLDSNTWEYLKALDSAWRSKEIKISIKTLAEAFKKRKIR